MKDCLTPASRNTRVPSTAIAKMVERSGATAVIAEGGESGGHVGDLTTMTLVPQVCDAVSIPVIAAGGIADGRGVAAAFMLGAQGVQLGTRFLVAKECGVSRTIKKNTKRQRYRTIVTQKAGPPVRCLKTPFSREFFSKNTKFDSNEELEALGRRAAGGGAGGDEKCGATCEGGGGDVKKEQYGGEIIEEIFTEAEQVLKKGLQWVK